MDGGDADRRFNLLLRLDDGFTFCLGSLGDKDDEGLLLRGERLRRGKDIELGKRGLLHGRGMLSTMLNRPREGKVRWFACGVARRRDCSMWLWLR